MSAWIVLKDAVSNLDGANHKQTDILTMDFRKDLWQGTTQKATLRLDYYGIRGVFMQKYGF